MFRRALGVSAGRRLSSMATTSASRQYTELSHMKYPVHTNAVCMVVGYLLVMWMIFVATGSRMSIRSAYKDDYLRVWRRKLGTGYQWSDAWGPQKDTIFKNLPEEVE